MVRQKETVFVGEKNEVAKNIAVRQDQVFYSYLFLDLKLHFEIRKTSFKIM